MLQLNHIAWTASDGKQVLKDVNLNVGDGKLVVITGPNGRRQDDAGAADRGHRYAGGGADRIRTARTSPDLDITERARRGISFAFQQPVRFKGLTVKDLHDSEPAAKDTLNEARGSANYLAEVGLCAQGLYRPGGGRDPSPAARSSASRSPRSWPASTKLSDL